MYKPKSKTKRQFEIQVFKTSNCMLIDIIYCSVVTFDMIMLRLKAKYPEEQFVICVLEHMDVIEEN